MTDATSPPKSPGPAPAVTPQPEAPTNPPGAGLAAVLGGAQDLSRLELIALLRADQAQRWQAGQRVPAEAYLQEVPALRDDPELAILLVFSEFLLRRDMLQEAPRLDEYLARFPQHATALRHQQELEALFQEVERTQGGHGPTPVTAAAPPGASEWTLVEAAAGAAAAPPSAPALPGYAVLGELGRGGMGLVLKGHDLHLGRDLAIKLLHDELQGQPHLVRRFLNEARVCGRLQHPGIVPIYQLGSLPDRRPYFTMKLVEGRTLADLLDERAGPGQDRPRFLTTFEQVCQTLAYAHSKGVIHRDLKPDNIMVGAFGEVQVMDWGLAKVLSRGADGPTVPVLAASPGSNGGPFDGADRWLGTLPGGALGTLPYMPPEQARGEVEQMDERCDVFGLGALLCEILTGRPPFSGRDGAELLARVKACNHAEALAALDGCVADAELVRLAKACLAAEPSDRPRDAGEVARELMVYLAGVQERLRAAEVERAAAEARAEEARATAVADRRARRRARGLAAALLALVAVGAGGGLVVQHQATARQADQARQQLTVESALEKAATLRQQARWREAAAVLEQARLVLGDTGPDDLRRRLNVAQAELRLVNRLDAIRQRRATLVEGKFDTRTAAADYAAAFREAGLGEMGDDETAVAARVQDSGVSGPLVAALDDWATVAGKPEARSWLLGVARRADPDAWGDRFRDPAVWRDRPALQALADDALRDHGAKLGQLSPQVLVSLGSLLIDGGDDAVPLLCAAQGRYPNDFWLTLELSYALRKAKQAEEVVGYCRVAVALRPDASVAHNNLGVALYDKKDLDGAIAAYRTAIALDPKHAPAHNNLGVALRDTKNLDGAIAECRTAIAIDPKLAPAHYNLGLALRDNKDLDGAIAAFRTAIAIDPKYAPAHYNLGNVLYDRKNLDGAIAAYRKAIAIDPKYAKTHYNLGIALYAKKDVDGAIAAYRQAIDNDPKYALAHYNLGAALAAEKDLDGAIAAYRKAIAIDPKYAEAHYNLGLALAAQKDLDGAIAEWRKAIDGDPKLAIAHYNLGLALQYKKNPDGAIAAYRKAIDIDPKFALPQVGLGQALLQQGRFAEARTETRRSLEHLAERDPLRQVASGQLQQCERLLALDEKLSAVLNGEAEPASAGERLALGQLCQQYKHRHAAAPRFYSDAFAADPKLAADLRQQHRYNAACSAALAATGESEDAKNLPDKVQRMLRAQALGWLRADLAVYAKLAERDDAKTRETVRQRLAHWQQDPDFTSVRDPEGLAKLPEAERAEWRRLWDDVAALLVRASAAPQPAGRP